MSDAPENSAAHVSASADCERPLRVTFPQAARTWIYIGLNSFGGPAGQIAVMHRVLVEEKKWISESRFLHALNYCMLLPGPEAQQLATYIGWLLHRTIGGLTAGILFVLPGFLAMLALSIVYAVYQETTFVTALFYGLKPAVLAVVIHAVMRIGRRALKNSVMWGLAAAAFVAIFFFAVPFPIIVISALLLGFVGGKLRPERFAVIQPHGQSKGTAAIDAALSDGLLEHARPSLVRSIRVLLVCLPLWFGPLLFINTMLGPDHVFTQQGIFFSKAAVVTFGGAYAVLAYVAQQAVEVYGWLGPGEMLDGLGMAETTPGPLIMVVQFVGFMGAFRAPGEMNPILAGTLASILVSWVTFVPCFLWIFLGAPYVESLRSNRSLSAALSAITAAVVGVILNLAVWFGLHTLFEVIDERRWNGMRFLIPNVRSIDLAALIITLIALALMFRMKVGMILTLLICATIGAAWHVLIR